MSNTPYLLPIKDTIVTSWARVSGAKGTVWAALAIIIAIGFGIGILAGLSSTLSQPVSQLFNFIGQIVSSLLQIGLLYIGIRRGRDETITYSQIFRVFEMPIALRIVGVYAIQFLIYLPISLVFILPPMLYFGPELNSIMASGFTASSLLLIAWSLLGVLVFFYLTLRMIMSMGLVVDKGVNSWTAIKMSFTATQSNLGRIFVLILVQLLVVILSVLTLGIALIWMIPFSLTIYGTAYNRLLVNIPNEVSTNK